jgi:aryl-alcohol dehydrogenase-like predicted oxidoreductase
MRVADLLSAWQVVSHPERISRLDPDEDIEKGLAAIAALQRQGIVRHIGVSNFNVAQMKLAQAIMGAAARLDAGRGRRSRFPL